MCTVLGQVLIRAAISGLNDSGPMLLTDKKHQSAEEKKETVWTWHKRIYIMLGSLDLQLLMS